MLKSLELFGFKSFADRTLFDFSPGITCVVGPNGSGKSNVVDAIKWILGDQSAKSLRGKEMSDVIFNGASGRRSSGFAEATLTFNNEQGLLPVDTREVSIGRRLYQSGDSEYLLNGAVVRLKDIRDVFMGTGAGTAAYSIIEQGRVDQILQANPTTRRLVFEEAAGISKFKSRRVDAERRLERVAQNLLRLTDIVDEVESQLNSTRSQASKAARFREVSAELEQMWTGLAADDYRHISEQLEAKAERFEQLQVEQGEVQQRIQSLESERQQTDQLISEFDDKLIDHERVLAANRQAIATSAATIHHQSTRLAEIESEIGRLRNQRAIAQARVSEIEAEFQSAQSQLHSFVKEFESARIAVEEKEKTVAQLRASQTRWRDEITSAREQLVEQDKKRQTAIERLAVLNSQSAAVETQRQEAQHEVDQFEDRVHAATAKTEERQQLVDDATVDYEKLQTEVEQLQQKRDELTEQKSLAAQQLVELRERRSADAARLSVLAELERRQEGIAIGVQEILHRSVTSRFPPWDRILGIVRDLIDVPIELAPIIDAALGERSTYIATADLGAFLDYLDRGAVPIDGRIGFIEVTHNKPPADSPALPSEDLDLTSESGVYGRADRLIADTERSPGVAQAVLGDTWIVETLADARRLLTEHKRASKLRFVTLQGEVLSADRELFVGVVPHESSIVSRKSELRQLRNSLHQHDRNIDSLIDRQAVLENSIAQKQKELTATRKDLERKASHVSECAAILAGQVNDLDRLRKEQMRKATQVEQLIEELNKTTQEVQSIELYLETSKQKAVEYKESIQQFETSIHEAESKLQQITIDMKSQQLEMAKHEERLSSLRDRQSHIEKEHRQVLRQSEEIQAQYQQSRQAQRRGEMSILNAESSIATHAIALEQTVRETRQFFLQRDELRKRRKEVSKLEEAAHHQRRELQDRQHELEIGQQSLRTQLESSGDRIFEEFQTPLEQLVQRGASAYQLYLAERYGEDVADTVLRDQNADSASDSKTTSIDDPATEEKESHFPNNSSEPVDDAIDQEDLIVPTFAEVREELEARVDRLRRKLKAMGHVNTEALESLEELEERYNSLSNQLMDLQQAKQALEDIIRKINVESERIFFDTFETIRGHFQELFRKLFGGGDADIILEDPDDVLECGIDIVARPPGKELRSISLLSGGEKTMTAVGMLFAMFKSKPSPYCILDEVDAALDEANVDRYVSVVQEFVEMTQFVVITHRKRTMTAANVLYGVTMEQAGVSKRISVKFEDVNDNGEIRTAA